MTVLTAPNHMNLTYQPVTLFLAGGITGTSDWQSDIISMLAYDTELVLINPRRENFPMNSLAEAPIQIEWEHTYLEHADAISFWFPPETLCPIALYELGAWSMTDKTIFVATDHDYKRRQDVIIQTRLARPDVRVGSTLADLVGDIERWRGERR